MILIWHEGALGDLLLSRLAIKAISQRHQGEVVLFARSEARYLFEEAGWVLEARPTNLGFLSRFNEIKILYLFANRPESYGFLTSKAQKVWPIFTRPRQKHLALEELEGLKGKIETLFLKDETQKRGLVILHPGSGAKYKCAPPHLWQRLGQLLEKTGYRVLYLIGPAERDLAPTFAQKAFFTEDLREVVNTLREAEFFIGHDSGLSHLAAALGIKTLALFGPTAWWHWAPFGRVTIASQACHCLLSGKDPRRCKDPCLAKVKAERLIQIFLSTIPRSFPPAELARNFGVARIPDFDRRKGFDNPLEGAGEAEGHNPVERWLGVPELGIQVVEVEEEHSQKG